MNSLIDTDVLLDLLVLIQFLQVFVLDHVTKCSICLVSLWIKILCHLLCSSPEFGA